MNVTATAAAEQLDAEGHAAPEVARATCSRTISRDVHDLALVRACGEARARAEAQDGVQTQSCR
ncbi:hypothetical protein [Kribbella sp. NPDC051770]|uniref:hypothetical protein n=1 Tax=Kribbella sp. NPDC051770 TaxID=3155413 RepID=UPI0034412483